MTSTAIHTTPTLASPTIQAPAMPAAAVPIALKLAERATGIEVQWARHQDDVRAAQRLRFDVFAGEMGARLNTPLAGHDVDLFDNFCEHLLVRDAQS
eukprot:gene26542-26747_t